MDNLAEAEEDPGEYLNKSLMTSIVVHAYMQNAQISKPPIRHDVILTYLISQLGWPGA